MLSKRLLSLAALPLLSLAQNSTQDLNATLSGNNQLTNLTALLAGNRPLLETLSNARNITILAPSNQAFAKLLASEGGSQALSSDPGRIAAVLTYHVLNGTYYASNITNSSQFVPSLLTNQSYTNVTGGQVVEAFRDGNRTVFYGGLFGNASVTEANVNFTGGVIHIVDSVLQIPQNVFDTALSTGLTSFYGAANFSNLVSTVNETRDLTIFAPSNEAFQSIGSVFSNISTNELASVLSYHVVNNTVDYSPRLTNGTTLTAANGQELRITIDRNGTYFVNAARIVAPNVLVANGVVHVIDNVLNANSTSGPSPSATSGVAAFSGTSVSDAPFTSGLPTATTTVNPTSAGSRPTNTASGSRSSGAAVPMFTGAMGYGALLGAGAAVFLGA